VENYTSEYDVRTTLQKLNFLIKIQKLKKGPLRGTPHNLSKVSLEVKRIKRLQENTLLQASNPKLD
jgi:hypothetical protein